MMLCVVIFAGIGWLSWIITMKLGPHPYIAVFAPEHLASVLAEDRKAAETLRSVNTK